MNQLKLQVIVSTSNASATKLLISNIHSCLVIHWRQGLGLDLYIYNIYMILKLKCFITSYIT